MWYENNYLAENENFLYIFAGKLKVYIRKLAPT